MFLSRLIALHPSHFYSVDIILFRLSLFSGPIFCKDSVGQSTAKILTTESSPFISQRLENTRFTRQHISEPRVDTRYLFTGLARRPDRGESLPPLGSRDSAQRWPGRINASARARSGRVGKCGRRRALLQERQPRYRCSSPLSNARQLAGRPCWKTEVVKREPVTVEHEDVILLIIRWKQIVHSRGLSPLRRQKGNHWRDNLYPEPSRRHRLTEAVEPPLLNS